MQDILEELIEKVNSLEENQAVSINSVKAIIDYLEENCAQSRIKKEKELNTDRSKSGSSS